VPAIAIPAAAKAALDTDFMVISVLLQWTNLETDPSIKLDLQTKCGRGVGCEITMRSSRSEGHSPFQDGDFAVPKGGESEQLVGMAIAGRRDDVIRGNQGDPAHASGAQPPGFISAVARRRARLSARH